MGHANGTRIILSPHSKVKLVQPYLIDYKCAKVNPPVFQVSLDSKGPERIALQQFMNRYTDLFNFVALQVWRYTTRQLYKLFQSV